MSRTNKKFAFLVELFDHGCRIDIKVFQDLTNAKKFINERGITEYRKTETWEYKNKEDSATITKLELEN